MGLEYITQPQVFLAPISAINGIAGINEPYPLLTSFQNWVTSSPVDATVYPIPGFWTMLDEPASFIVSVGGVVQAPGNYTVNRTLRLLTFNSVVSANTEVAVTQLATAAPSSSTFDYIESVNSEFQSLTAFDLVSNTIETSTFRADNCIQNNITVTTLSVVDVVTGPTDFDNDITCVNIYGTESKFVYISAQELLADETTIQEFEANNIVSNTLSSYNIDSNSQIINTQPSTTYFWTSTINVSGTLEFFLSGDVQLQSDEEQYIVSLDTTTLTENDFTININDRIIIVTEPLTSVPVVVNVTMLVPPEDSLSVYPAPSGNGLVVYSTEQFRGPILVTNDLGKISINSTEFEKDVTVVGSISAGGDIFHTGDTYHTGNEYHTGLVNSTTLIAASALSANKVVVNDGIGYTEAFQAGTSVTQQTSKQTPVSCNGLVGKITMAAGAINANTTTSFTLNNTSIRSTDFILANHISGGTLGTYKVTIVPGVNLATVFVRNITGGSLNDAIVIHFMVLRSPV